MSNKATITWLDEPLVKTNRLEGAWTGSISIKESLTPAQLKEIRKSIADFYVATKPGTSIRCIDGRPAKNQSSNPGPQIAGGSPCLALAYCMIKPAKDIDQAILSLLANHGFGFVAGAHIDNHAKELMCGCGAIDKMPEIINRIHDHGESIKDSAEVILGSEYNQEAFNDVLEFYASINVDSFLPEGYRKKAIATIKQEDGAVEEVTGAHKEIAIIINLLPNTTFDKDRFAGVNQNKYQVFNYDYWLSMLVSSKVHRDKKQKIRFLTAQVIYNVAAAMVLTDGSLALGVRQ